MGDAQPKGRGLQAGLCSRRQFASCSHIVLKLRGSGNRVSLLRIEIH